MDKVIVFIVNTLIFIVCIPTLIITPFVALIPSKRYSLYKKDDDDFLRLPKKVLYQWRCEEIFGRLSPYFSIIIIGPYALIHECLEKLKIIKKV
jgi:hypothetical protein